MTLIVYLIAVVLLLAAAGVIFGILFRRDYERKGRLSPFSLLVGALIWFAFGGFPAIYLARDWPAVHVGPVAGVMGKISLWGGLAIMFLGIAQLGLLRALGHKQNALKQTGFYRLSRNPQIIGCALYVLGFAVLWPSWYALGWAIIFAVMAHVMVLGEEEHLRKRYNEDYARYCERVPRYLGLSRKLQIARRSRYEREQMCGM